MTSVWHAACGVLAGAAMACAAGTFEKELPEGNYAVTMKIGSASGKSDTTVKSEQRRLSLGHVKTKAGEFVSRTIIVNTRTPRIGDSGQSVKLKQREKESEVVEWDGKLSLEFLGENPSVVVEKVEPSSVPTVYVMGDSTVCDQPNEPWASWGQMLPRFFKPTVAVANYAESGESLRSSLGGRRLDKVLSVIKPGDYLFIQFGHNDMKAKGDGVGAFTTYTRDLKKFADAGRENGATVVLVTSMERKAGVENDTLGDYPEAVRRLASEQKLPLIDLHAMSKVLYRALAEDIGKAFQDGTHHNNYGAYELAKCVVQGIKEAKIPLANEIAEDFVGFDPATPDPVDGFDLPASTSASTTKPEGN